MIALGSTTLKPKVAPPKLRQPAVQPGRVVKGNGSKATPGKTPPAVKGNTAVPSNFKMTDEDRIVRIAVLYKKVTGGAKGLNRKAIVAKLKARFELCKKEGRDFGISDFIAVFGDITRPAWKAFTGGNSLRSAADLLYCFEKYEEHFVATNQNFEYFRDCTEITIVPTPKVMSRFMRRNMKAILKYHYDTAKRILSYVTDRGFREKLKGNQLREALKSRYKSLDAKQKEKFHRLLAAALFNDLYLYALKKKWDISSLKDLHKDPLLSRAFAGRIFKKSIGSGESSVKESDFKAFTSFAKRVNNLRARLGSQAEAVLRDVNPNTKEFYQALKMAEGGKPASDIADYIKKNCPKVTDGKNKKASGKVAAPGGRVNIVAQ